MAAMPDDFDDEPGDDGLRALVKMAREDFDEDPPARLDALLMAAARQHAPRPKAGVFERVRRWLAASMLSPAIAGATALAVIGGTAGVLYMRNQGKVAQEPTVSRTEAPARTEREETAPAPPTEFTAQLQKNAEPTSPIVAPKDPPPPEPKPDPDPEPELKQRPRGGGDRGADVVATTGNGPGTTIVDGLEDRRFAGGVVTDMAGGGGAGIGEDVESAAQESPRPPPPPPPPPDESLDLETTTAKIAESGRTDHATVPSNRSQAENLHRQARNAARQKQCAPVKLMAQRTRKLDEDYYANQFAKDPDIKPCL